MMKNSDTGKYMTMIQYDVLKAKYSQISETALDGIVAYVEECIAENERWEVMK